MTIRRKARLLLGALLLGVTAAALAQLAVGAKAPDFPRGTVWIGSSGAHPSMKELKGKVVIVDFWDYTCINCIRTFPHLKQWYARYHKDGLEIVGVHRAEFLFANDPKNIERAYARFQLPYPAIADVKDEIWGSYKADSWPETFLIDRSGVIREVRKGEGDYGKEERLIQELLKQGHSELDYSAIVIPEDKDLFTRQCGDMSPEILVGATYSKYVGATIANVEGFQEGKVVDYKPTEKRIIKGFFAQGKWMNRASSLESAEDQTPSAPISLGISYRGREVYAVLDRATQQPVEVVVTRDGKPIPEAQRGVDVKARPDGQTVVVIDEPKMYYITAKDDDTKTHELVFSPSQKGARICSFTFSNRCLEDFEKL
ncbi:MAG TPA: redoxin domain-containing protein [Thermoanaerobaculia bacterium]